MPEKEGAWVRRRTGLHPPPPSLGPRPSAYRVVCLGRLSMHGKPKAPVHRHDLTAPDDEVVTDGDLVDRDLRHARVIATTGCPWSPLDEQTQLPPGPSVCTRLEQLPAGQHHRDHCPRERLANEQGAGQCQ
jgi:hypothetical protein